MLEPIHSAVAPANIQSPMPSASSSGGGTFAEALQKATGSTSDVAQRGSSKPQVSARAQSSPDKPAKEKEPAAANDGQTTPAAVLSLTSPVIVPSLSPQSTEMVATQAVGAATTDDPAIAVLAKVNTRGNAAVLRTAAFLSPAVQTPSANGQAAKADPVPENEVSPKEVKTAEKFVTDAGQSPAIGAKNIVPAETSQLENELPISATTNISPVPREPQSVSSVATAASSQKISTPDPSQELAGDSASGKAPDPRMKTEALTRSPEAKTPDESSEITPATTKVADEEDAKKAVLETVAADVAPPSQQTKETVANGASLQLADPTNKKSADKAGTSFAPPPGNGPAIGNDSGGAPPAVSKIPTKHGNETPPASASKSESPSADDATGTVGIDASAKHATVANSAAASTSNPTDNVTAHNYVAPQAGLVEKTNTASTEPATHPASPSPRLPADNPRSDLPPTGGVQSARLLDKLGQTEMHIGLRTTAFGTVEVHTVVRESQVGLTISSEKGDLRSLLSAEIPELQTSLRQHNLRLDEVKMLQPNVSSGGESFSQGQSQQRFSRSPLAHNSAAPSQLEEQPAEMNLALPIASSARSGLNIHA